MKEETKKILEEIKEIHEKREQYSSEREDLYEEQIKKFGKLILSTGILDDPNWEIWTNSYHNYFMRLYIEDDELFEEIEKLCNISRSEVFSIELWPESQEYKGQQLFFEIDLYKRLITAEFNKYNARDVAKALALFNYETVIKAVERWTDKLVDRINEFREIIAILPET